MTAKRWALRDSLILACLTVILIWPLFRLVYLDRWTSIESTFIADARMLAEHLPHPGWQPLWYCGTRTDYIYPPALAYGTLLISKIGHVAPARAYHLFTAIFYVFGIVGVYWLVLIGSASRAAAWLSAAATALISPSFFLLRDIRHDSIYLVPQRLHVLMAYGEGPHISSLCVLPAALAAALVALRNRRTVALAAASALCALVVAINFYGAVALGIFYPVMVWSVWNGERNRAVLWRAAAIPLLAYGLSAFWLTPSYVSVTLTDLKWVAPPVTPGGWIILALLVAAWCVLTARFAAKRPEREWGVFVAGLVAILGLCVLGLYSFGLRITGDPNRLLPEFDLAFILGGVEIFRLLRARPKLRIPAVLLVLLAFYPAIRYLRHAWSPFPKAAPLDTVYEYKTTQWVHDHLPGARVLPSGTVRYWFDVWADNAQPDGGSAQGMLDQHLPDATWQILHGDRADLAILWLQALGTSAVVVPDQNSWEPYHDYQFPGKFRGALPPVYDDGHGTVIYSVPRVHPAIARVVENARLNQTGPIRGGGDFDSLSRYVAVVEDATRPEATLAWRGTDEADVRATVSGGESVLVQETYDPAWRAYENAAPLPIRMEPVMGFMLIDAPPGVHDIQMRFETPLENRFGQVLFVITLVALAILLRIHAPGRRAPN